MKRPPRSTTTLTVALMGFTVACGGDTNSAATPGAKNNGNSAGNESAGNESAGGTSLVDHPNVTCAEITSVSLCKVTGAITTDLTMTKADEWTANWTCGR